MLEIDEAPKAPQKTILIIEDSITVRQFLRRMFEREMPEMLLIEAEDGKKALNEMTRSKADLIVTDLQMPGMGGRSFIAKLRSNPLLRKKNVLVLSSENLSDLRKTYQGDQGIVFMNKPAGSEEIIAQARALLSALNPISSKQV